MESTTRGSTIHTYMPLTPRASNVSVPPTYFFTNFPILVTPRPRPGGLSPGTVESTGRDIGVTLGVTVACVAMLCLLTVVLVWRLRGQRVQNAGSDWGIQLAESRDERDRRQGIQGPVDIDDVRISGYF